MDTSPFRWRRFNVNFLHLCSVEVHHDDRLADSDGYGEWRLAVEEVVNLEMERGGEDTSINTIITAQHAMIWTHGQHRIMDRLQDQLMG